MRPSPAPPALAGVRVLTTPAPTYADFPLGSRGSTCRPQALLPKGAVGVCYSYTPRELEDPKDAWYLQGLISKARRRNSVRSKPCRISLRHASKLPRMTRRPSSRALSTMSLAGQAVDRDRLRTCLESEWEGAKSRVGHLPGAISE